MADREVLIGAIGRAVRNDELFRAAFLGGADASGRVDAHSDVDLVVIVEEGRDEEAFSAIEGALMGVGPIAHFYRLASPTWHGHEQAFWQVEGFGHAGLVDVVVLHPGEEGRWLVAERHGAARVLVDRDGLIKAAPLDREELGRTLAKRVADLRARVPVLAPLALKEAQRGRAMDALNFYHGLVLRPLVEMLRIVHCPERWDYGMRQAGSGSAGGCAREGAGAGVRGVVRGDRAGVWGGDGDVRGRCGFHEDEEWSCSVPRNAVNYVLLFSARSVAASATCEAVARVTTGVPGGGVVFFLARS
jgi:hypothetical protein